jgi:hypothetical protein
VNDVAAALSVGHDDGACWPPTRLNLQGAIGKLDLQVTQSSCVAFLEGQSYTWSYLAAIQIHLVLFGMQNRTLPPYLAAIKWILILVVNDVKHCTLPAPQVDPEKFPGMVVTL